MWVGGRSARSNWHHPNPISRLENSRTIIQMVTNLSPLTVYCCWIPHRKPWTGIGRTPPIRRAPVQSGDQAEASTQTAQHLWQGRVFTEGEVMLLHSNLECGLHVMAFTSSRKQTVNKFPSFHCRLKTCWWTLMNCGQTLSLGKCPQKSISLTAHLNHIRDTVIPLHNLLFGLPQSYIHMLLETGGEIIFTNMFTQMLQFLREYSRWFEQPKHYCWYE